MSNAHVSNGRRRLVRVAGAIGMLGAVPLGSAAAVPVSDRAALFAALGGVPLPTTQITLQVADIADNGASVPVVVSSSLTDVTEIHLVVDGNPEPFAASFAVPVGTEAFVATRIKLAQSSMVYAAVRTGSGLYAVARTVQVTVGGCS